MFFHVCLTFRVFLSLNFLQKLNQASKVRQGSSTDDQIFVRVQHKTPLKMDEIDDPLSDMYLGPEDDSYSSDESEGKAVPIGMTEFDSVKLDGMYWGPESDSDDMDELEMYMPESERKERKEPVLPTPVQSEPKPLVLVDAGKVIYEEAVRQRDQIGVVTSNVEFLIRGYGLDTLNVPTKDEEEKEIFQAWFVVMFPVLQALEDVCRHGFYNIRKQPLTLGIVAQFVLSLKEILLSNIDPDRYLKSRYYPTQDPIDKKDFDALWELIGKRDEFKPRLFPLVYSGNEISRELARAAAKSSMELLKGVTNELDVFVDVLAIGREEKTYRVELAKASNMQRDETTNKFMELVTACPRLNLPVGFVHNDTGLEFNGTFRARHLRDIMQKFRDNSIFATLHFTLDKSYDDASRQLLQEGCGMNITVATTQRGTKQHPYTPFTYGSNRKPPSRLKKHIAVLPDYHPSKKMAMQWKINKIGHIPVLHAAIWYRKGKQPILLKTTDLAMENQWIQFSDASGDAIRALGDAYAASLKSSSSFSSSPPSAANEKITTTTTANTSPSSQNDESPREGEEMEMDEEEEDLKVTIPLLMWRYSLGKNCIDKLHERMGQLQVLDGEIGRIRRFCLAILDATMTSADRVVQAYSVRRKLKRRNSTEAIYKTIEFEADSNKCITRILVSSFTREMHYRFASPKMFPDLARTANVTGSSLSSTAPPASSSSAGQGHSNFRHKQPAGSSSSVAQPSSVISSSGVSHAPRAYGAASSSYSTVGRVAAAGPTSSSSAGHTTAAAGQASTGGLASSSSAGVGQEPDPYWRPFDASWRERVLRKRDEAVSRGRRSTTSRSNKNKGS